MRKKSVLLGLLACFCLSVVSAQATILTFEDLNIENYDPIPATYGDHANSLNDGTGSYSIGNILTPNIVVKYRTVSPSGETVLNSISYWLADYGDLLEVGYPASNGNFAEISLIADPGYDVILNSFHLAGWSHFDQPGQTVRILDKNNNVLVDYSPVDIEGDNGHSFFAPRARGNILRIQFGPSWNTGIDNINYDQARSLESSGEIGGNLVNKLKLRK